MIVKVFYLGSCAFVNVRHCSHPIAFDAGEKTMEEHTNETMQQRDLITTTSLFVTSGGSTWQGTWSDTLFTTTSYFEEKTVEEHTYETKRGSKTAGTDDPNVYEVSSSTPITIG